MDDNGHRENGRHKADPYKSMHTQWIMPQHQMKDSYTLKLMAIMSERDKAIHERNLALSEKKASLAERDMAMLQRDAAISERNTAIMERDNAIAALEYTRENCMNGHSGPGCPPGCPTANVTKHIQHHHQQQHHHQHLEQSPHLSDALYNHTRDVHTSEAFLSSPVSEGAGKGRKAKRKKETEVQHNQSKKKTKSPRKSKKGGADDLNEEVKTAKSEVEGGNDLNKQASAMKQLEWKSQDLGLNQVAFDETTMPAPVCSCTGKYQQCYKWGNGGWQSACCTMTLSMHPLPVMPNKRHARMGGRKMSGSVFNKLLSRLAAEGHDLSTPLDLKDHWAKHGTNRYITIR